MASQQTPAFVRTLIPIIVGFLVARFGVDSNDPTTALVVNSVVSYLWYVVVHTIELKYPQFGYLLGIPKAPAYSPADAPSPGPGEHMEAVVVADAPDPDAPAEGEFVTPMPPPADMGDVPVDDEADVPDVDAAPPVVQPAAKATPKKRAPRKKA